MSVCSGYRRDGMDLRGSSNLEHRRRSLRRQVDGLNNPIWRRSGRTRVLEIAKRWWESRAILWVPIAQSDRASAF
jgi:hypothetical protein